MSHSPQRDGKKREEQVTWQSVHWLKILNERHTDSRRQHNSHTRSLAFEKKWVKTGRNGPCRESDEICKHSNCSLYFVLVYFSGGFVFPFFSFLSTTYRSLFNFPSFLFLSLSFLRTLSFASVTCTQFSLDTRWPTSTVTARCLHFPHNALRFLATGRRMDCVFVSEPGFVSVVFIFQWWPITLPPVFVLFRLITWVMGRVKVIPLQAWCGPEGG